MLTKDQYKSLCNSHPEHRALIDKMDGEGKGEAEIKAAIASSINQANADRVKALEKELADTKAQHATELKAEKDEHGKTKTKLAALEKNAPPADVGGGDPAEGKKTVTQAEFDKMTAAQRAVFFANNGEIAVAKV